MVKLNIQSVPVTVKYFPGRKSRVVNSFFGFLFGSALNILKAFRDYAPLKFFGVISVILLTLGMIFNFFTFFHFIINGSFFPYTFIAFIGGYLTTFAFIFFIVGLVADMLDRIRNNQEKILFLLKEVKFSSVQK